MQTEWLLDFLSLVQTRSFSRSAELRHVTQPAFSRRIRSLEAWAKVDLVDRSKQPLSLTPAGQTLYGNAREIVQLINVTRAALHSEGAIESEVIEFAAPHALALAFFPHWLEEMRETCGDVKTTLRAFNVNDAVNYFAERHCDLLISYSSADQPLSLDPERYECIQLGTERVRPYSLPDDRGNPLHKLPSSPLKPTPYLAYSNETYLGGVVYHTLKRHGGQGHLHKIFETDMAESLKAMALNGSGIAFLPETTVRKEVISRQLVIAAEGLDATLDICIYSHRRQHHHTTFKKALYNFWTLLQEAQRRRTDSEAVLSGSNAIATV